MEEIQESMELRETGIEGLIEIAPRVFGDERGWFLESYNQARYDSLIKGTRFIQDNLSCSMKGVVRGLHFQAPPFSQAKLVSVIQGKVLDVAVDLRRTSATYGKVFTVILDGERKNQLFIPRGFAHGFASLEDQTVFAYKCDNPYSKESERTLLWNDSDLDIDWGVTSPSLSEKDKTGEAFRSFRSPFE